MKPHPSPFHFSMREKRALRVIVDTITAHIDALIIYCITSVSTTMVERSCFTSAVNMEEWHFECDLLIIVRNGAETKDTIKQEIEKRAAPFGKVVVFIYPVADAQKQLKDKDPFLCAAVSGAVLYEKNKASRLLVAKG